MEGGLNSPTETSPPHNNNIPEELEIHYTLHEHLENQPHIGIICYKFLLPEGSGNGWGPLALGPTWPMPKDIKKKSWSPALLMKKYHTNFGFHRIKDEAATASSVKHKCYGLTTTCMMYYLTFVFNSFFQ